VLAEAARNSLIVLEDLCDASNVGAMFRNALLAFGAGAVFLSPGTADPLYRKSIRVSAGAVECSMGFGCRRPWRRIANPPLPVSRKPLDPPRVREILRNVAARVAERQGYLLEAPHAPPYLREHPAEPGRANPLHLVRWRMDEREHFLPGLCEAD